MTSLGVLATSVKNNNENSDVRFMLLKLPNTNVFAGENGPLDSGVCCIYCLVFISNHSVM